MKTLSTENKIFAGVIGATLLLIFAAAFTLGKGTFPNTNNNPSTLAADTSVLVRDNSHYKGPKEAKVTIVEFSDFECPACQAAQPALNKTLADYKDKSVRFVYREFPLPSHQYAFLAAEAAEAAGLQNKFWEMHDRLFAEFEKNPELVLSKDTLTGYAKDLELDTAKFALDLDSDSVRQRVLDDQNDGNKVGLSATPTFFINGTAFTGGLSVDQFAREIDFRLK